MKLQIANSLPLKQCDLWSFHFNLNFYKFLPNGTLPFELCHFVNSLNPLKGLSYTSSKVRYGLPLAFGASDLPFVIIRISRVAIYGIIEINSIGIAIDFEPR